MRTSKLPWENIDYVVARNLYDQRFNTHRELRRVFDEGDIPQYVPLALGIVDPSGNYSAHEHGLGPQILQFSQQKRVFELASRLFKCVSPEDIPRVIYEADLPYLKISVGSEMAAMLCPDVFWVTNVRTVWAHLLLRHNGDISRANEELHLYREPDRDRARDSEMRYRIWKDIHQLVGPSLAELASRGSLEAAKQNVQSGDVKYLWADAIADTLYNEFADS